MKSVISALIIFALIITMAGVSSVFVNNIGDDMLQSLYKNEKYIANNDWENAENETNYVSDVWQKNRVAMSVIFNHSAIDNIDATLEKMKKTVKFQRKESFLYEKSFLSCLIKALKEQQKVSIGNIF